MGGISYAWGVFVIPMMDAYGWTKFEATLPFTVFMAVFALVMVPGGRLQDRFGPRKVAIAGAVCFLAAYGLAALVDVVPFHNWLVLTYGVLGGSACGLTYACVAPPVRKWFPDKPALAVSLAVMGFGLAAIFFAPLKAKVLIPRLGIGGTFLLIAFLTSSVSALAGAFTRNPPIDWIPPARHGSSPGTTAIQDIPPSLAVRTGKFWAMWGVFILSVAGGFISLGLIPSYAQRAISLSPSQAALAISLFSGVNGLGRPLAGWLGDRIGITKVMSLTFILQAAIFLVFELLAVNMALLLSLTAVLGWAYAVILGLFPSMTAAAFGVKNLGTNYGLVFTAFGVGAFAPLAGAGIFDATGRFSLVFLAAGISSALGAGLCLAMRRRYAMS
jgi:OFA family oxalate/formate antiporter-like MFS transporter